MSEETPRYQVHGDEALEARIVAWVLGESSPFEAEELQRLCAERPELEIFRRRIHAVHGLLGEVVAPVNSPAWKLSPSRRTALDAALGARALAPANVIVPKKRKTRYWLSAVAALAILVALSGLFAPMAVRQRKSASDMAARQEIVAYYDAQPSELGVESAPMADLSNAEVARREMPPAPSASALTLDENLVRGNRARSVTSNSPRSLEIPVPGITTAEPSTGYGDADAFGGGWGEGALANNATPKPADMPVMGRLFDGEASAMPVEDAQVSIPSTAPVDAKAGENAWFHSGAALTYEHRQAVEDVRRNLYQAEGKMELGQFDDAKKAYEETLRIDPYNQAARRGMERIADAKSDHYRAAYDHTRAELLMEVDKAWELAIPAEQPPPPSITSTESIQSLTPEQAKALRALEEAAEDARKELANIVRTKGTVYSDENSGAQSAQNAIGMLQQEIIQKEAQFQSLQQFDGDQLMAYAAGLDMPENNVRNLRPQYLARQAELQRLKSNGLQQGHPDLVAAEKQLEELRSQVEEEAKGLRATLAAQLEIGKDRLARVEAMREEAREEAIQRGIGVDDYTEAKARFEEAQRRLEAAKARLLPKPEKPKAPPPAPENETSAATDPFSTFSLNVSDASFVIARDAIRRGERPTPDQIRVEQFYNALDYGDPAPAAGEAVATRIEQVVHPVLPGRNLVRIGARVGSTGRAASQPLHLTLLVDQSGSMVRADRQAILQSSLATLATLLGENDVVHVIGFARQPRLIAEALPGNRSNEIARLIHQAAAEGGTNMEAALGLAQQIAARHHKAGAQNRVVILSDGAANLGDADPARLAERITAMRQQGIATDIAGIGSDGINDALLAELARHGDGRYHVVTAETGPRLATDLAGTFRPAASDVKVQVVFNPERVGGWKLIGFEEHRLNAEDFRNDAVDAAELAAEEAGVAIYQIETLPQGQGEIGEVFIRFRDAATGQIVERSWPIAYQPATAALDQATPSMQLATLAMLVAEKLRGGPLGEAIDLPSQLPLVEALRPHFRHDARAKELFEMITHLTNR